MGKLIVLIESSGLDKKRLISHITEILKSILGPCRTKRFSIPETQRMINRAELNNPENRDLTSHLLFSFLLV